MLTNPTFMVVFAPNPGKGKKNGSLLIEKGPLSRSLVLRRVGSNHRPSGYEPDELPLLYFAMWTAKLLGINFPTK